MSEEDRRRERLYKALRDKDWDVAMQEASPDKYLEYLKLKNASTGGSVGDDGPGYEGRLASANDTKDRLLREISETVAELRPMQLPSTLSRWVVPDPEVEAQWARAREQLNKLYMWIRGLDPADAETVDHIHSIRESWRSYQRIYDWLGFFESSCQQVQSSKWLAQVAERLAELKSEQSNKRKTERPQ